MEGWVYGLIYFDKKKWIVWVRWESIDDLWLSFVFGSNFMIIRNYSILKIIVFVFILDDTLVSLLLWKGIERIIFIKFVINLRDFLLNL